MTPRPYPSGATKVAAVIGDPIAHSLSPVIHNAAFAACGIDWIYVALPVAAGGGADAVSAMRDLGIAGMSVTMPHKADVIAAADEVSDVAASLRASNCLISLGGGRILADNTDGRGFVDGLHDDFGISPEGLTFAVIGAGGAARAVVQAVANAGAREVVVVNRTADRAEVAARLAGPAGRVGLVEAVGAADVVVNATPIGMSGHGGWPCDPALLSSGQIAIDLIYEPNITPWLSAFADRGLRTSNGLSMLVRQAAVAFRSWTGIEPPVTDMREAAIGALADR